MTGEREGRQGAEGRQDAQKKGGLRDAAGK